MEGYNDIYRVGNYEDWQEIDVIVSRDCLLRCKYCYLDKKKDVNVSTIVSTEESDIIEKNT